MHLLPRLLRLLLAGTAALLALHGPALAQGEPASTFPSKPVRLVLPFAPGGTTDIMSRLLAVKFQQETGQALVVDNKPGAGGIIATELVARAPADGYTVLLGSSAQLALNPALYAKVPYDSARDFAAVALLGATPNVILVHPDQPERSLADLIRIAKAQPGKVSFGSPGAGSTAHLAAELLKLKTGIDMVHIPYKGGGPVLADALGGQVPVSFIAIPSVVAPVKAGRLRALAVTGAQRSPALPDVPTVAETLPGFEAAGWYGVVAPAGTPPEVVNRLYTVLRHITDMPDVRAAWAAQGIDTLGGTPAEFGGYIKTELVKWAEVVKRSGAKVE